MTRSITFSQNLSLCQKLLWLLLKNLVTGVDGTVIYLLSRSLCGILQADIKINCFTRERNSVRRLELWCRVRKKERERRTELVVMRNSVRREERSPVRNSAGEAHCTALGTFYQWMQCYFSAGDNIIISLGRPGPATLLFILFLEIGCEKPEILYVGC